MEVTSKYYLFKLKLEKLSHDGFFVSTVTEIKFRTLRLTFYAIFEYFGKLGFLQLSHVYTLRFLFQ